MQQNRLPRPFARGLYDGIPIALGYLCVSFGFGISAVKNGLSAFHAVLISLTNLTSAGQMAGIGIIMAHGSFFEMALTQLTINIRYFLMSLSLSQKLDRPFSLPHRFLCAFGITDEVYCVSSMQPRKLVPRYLYGLILLPFVGWAIGTLLGALAGNYLPLAIKNALGIAIYGMFVAIIVPPAKTDHGVQLTIFFSAICSCVFAYVPLFDFMTSGFSIIICAIVAAAVAAYFFPIPVPKAANADEEAPS
jgi:predicted branched-subunit amino acid permease